MTKKKTVRSVKKSRETEYMESVVDILDQEMTAAGRQTMLKTDSDDVNTLVSYLIGSLSDPPNEE